MKEEEKRRRKTGGLGGEGGAGRRKKRKVGKNEIKIQEEAFLRNWKAGGELQGKWNQSSLRDGNTVLWGASNRCTSNLLTSTQLHPQEANVIAFKGPSVLLEIFSQSKVLGSRLLSKRKAEIISETLELYSVV